MKSLKELLMHTPKEEVYEFYCRLCSNPLAIKRISREGIFKYISSLYQDTPEVILKLSNIEEMNILKKMLEEPLDKNNKQNYLEYVLMNNLKSNYLVIETEDNYIIPEDIYNYVKMALNIFDEKEQTYLDVLDNTLVGLLRIYNCLPVKELISILKNQNISIKEEFLPNYILSNPKINNKISYIKYKNKKYIISLEYPYYKEILEGLCPLEVVKPKYNLEELISIGKYHINLFDEHVYKFLSYIEITYKAEYVYFIITSLILYSGLAIEDVEFLEEIFFQNEKKINLALDVITHLPVWIFHGHSASTFKSNIILPSKNSLCICGSGKKFKDCCYKYYI